MNVSKAGGMGRTDKAIKAIRHSFKKAREGSIQIEGGISKLVMELVLEERESRRKGAWEREVHVSSHRSRVVT